MKKYLQSLILSLLLPLLGFAATAAENEPPKRILMIYGFTDIGIWEQQFTVVVNNALYPHVVISPEFLRLNVPETQEAALIAKLEQFQPGPFDLIIAVMPAASSFVNQWGADFLPDTPRLYVLPNNETINEVSDRNSVTVLPSASRLALTNTLQLIPRVLPDLEHLYVLSGNSLGDRTYLTRIQSIIDELALGSELQIHYLVGLPPDELVSTLNDANSNSAMLLGSYDRDGTGQNNSPNLIASLLHDQVPLPLFGFMNTLMGEGIIGGSLTSSVLYGEITVDLIRSILFDEPIPDLISPPVIFTFDGQELDRWDINRSLLPKGSSIVNEDPSILRQYRWQIGSGVLLVLLQLIFIVALMESLRKRRKAEKERDREILDNTNQARLFESVINSIPDAILIADADARIIESNLGASRVFGFNQQMLVGMKLSDLVDDLDANADSNLLSIENLDNNSEPKVIICRKHNCETFPGEAISTKIVSVDGDALGYLALVRDISKRLSEEEEQRQGQKMEALGNMVGGISHDFNNMLGVISGYAELTLATETKPSSEANLTKILKTTNRAKSLVGQIMTFSRDTSTVKKPIDLGEVLRETIKLVEVSVPGSITITTDIDERIQPVLGSEVQLQQIVMNLVTNSHQAMKLSGGRISVSLKRELLKTELNISHGVLQPGGYSVLTVEDNGPGMSRDIAARIFEPFFTTKDKGEGSGMGMAIVYKLMKAHEAKIDLHSIPNAGTRITLYFREFIGPATKRSESVDMPIVNGNGERILVVDDEEDLLDSASKLLINIGYQVDAYSDPEAALEKFEDSPEDYDLIVSDANMPHISGVQLLSRARKVKPRQRAIIITGYSEDLHQCEMAGMDLDSVVRKPFTLHELSTAIRDALSTNC